MKTPKRTSPAIAERAARKLADHKASKRNKSLVELVLALSQSASRPALAGRPRV